MKNEKKNYLHNNLNRPNTVYRALASACRRRKSCWPTLPLCAWSAPAFVLSLLAIRTKCCRGATACKQALALAFGWTSPLLKHRQLTACAPPLRWLAHVAKKISTKCYKLRLFTPTSAKARLPIAHSSPKRFQTWASQRFAISAQSLQNTLFLSLFFSSFFWFFENWLLL